MTAEEFFDLFNVPKYIGEGDVLPIYPCGSGNYQLCIKGARAEDFSEYTQAFVKAGFHKISQNSICKNIFERYESSDYSAYVVFMPDILTLRVICGPKISPCSRDISGNAVTRPAVAQLGIKLGMCYCIILADGTFLMVDGGVDNDEDRDMVYEFLCSYTPNGKRPVIRAWFITHTHPDHTRIAESFCEKYHGEVDLLEAIYNFPDFANVTVLRESAENNRLNAERFADTVKRCYPNATHTVCHTGDVIEFSGVKVTTLITHEDIYPIPIVSSNHTSSAWRFDFEGGASFVCLGDIWTQACEQLAKTFSAEYLKADIMQVTHHGLLGGHIDLYRAVDPEIVLWPSPEDRFAGRYVDAKREEIGKPTVQYCIGEGGCDYNVWIRDQSIKERKHYHAGKTVVLPV